MDYDELIKAIDKAKKVLVYCYYGQGINQHEGEYFEVSKKNAIEIIKKHKWWLEGTAKENGINARVAKINDNLLIG